MPQRRLLLGILLLGWACDARSPEAAPLAREAPRVDAAAGPVELAPPPPPQVRPAPKPREVQVKAASPESAELKAGARLSAQQTLKLPKGSEITLDFERGARLRIVGPALVAMALDSKDALLLKEGVVTVDLSPSAPTPNSGFTLFTPSAKLSLVRGGHYAVRVFADGVSRVFVASGFLLASSAAVDATTALGAEESATLAVDGSVERKPQQVQTLEKAEQAARALRPPKRPTGPMTALDQLLSQRIDSVRPLLDKEHELVRQHRALLGVADADVLGAQGALAENAAHLARELGRLRSALAQRAAARIGLYPGDDDLGQSAQRILQRLP